VTVRNTTGTSADGSALVDVIRRGARASRSRAVLRPVVAATAEGPLRVGPYTLTVDAAGRLVAVLSDGQAWVLADPHADSPAPERLL
jgi:hypothetical protein